jgi:hypothetical protein
LVNLRSFGIPTSVCYSQIANERSIIYDFYSVTFDTILKPSREKILEEFFSTILEITFSFWF